ncbi:ABC transporter substrate-binding protein [Nostocaceae cyanobacterium CENA369]|uniref:ABC transporter substrate-binding protein n=1 Tax=Dendronalium phyllosphericum CENA369 TaxID=1725256 RepID=A0A8J7LF90_9NOST|nr:iron-siderophore ABC transporter substrate-binding protein [Dendronalium phyllosphericum]MBH8571734.1 ABC transporter substrate-binding protein [Dendronalium phyllosphericum CENA369]
MTKKAINTITALLILVKAVCLLTFAKFVRVVRSIFSSLPVLWKPRRISHKYKLLPFVLTIVVILAIAACQNDKLQLEKKQTSSTAGRSPIATKVINHALGQVEIPLKPQRVIVLEENLILDSVVALGVKPVGVVFCRDCEENFRGIPNQLLTNVPVVGSIGSQPSLEKILSLKPDLILGLTSLKNSYGLLSQIAPTVLIDFPSMYDFKERLRYVAQVLGKSDRAEELLTQYQNRIQKLRQQLGQQLKTRTISVIYLAGAADIFYTYRPDFLAFGQIISDVGLQLIQQNQKQPQLTLSIEVLPQSDADTLFIMTELLARDFKQANSQPLSFLQKPIWSILKAVRNKEVYRVNWTVGGPIGANRIIDDLFKYLVNAA